MKPFNSTEDNPFSLSIGDLMAALLFVFILIAVVTMNIVKVEKELISKYQSDLKKVYDALHKEFDDDLGAWDAAIIDSTLSIVFTNPELQFESGQDTVKKIFKDRLSNFFPRYINVLRNDSLKDIVEEVRIEGHTDSDIKLGQDEDEGYLSNLDLSQRRSSSIIKYCFSIVKDAKALEWAKQFISASGFSSSKLIRDDKGAELKRQSRRVEFRVRANAKRLLKER